MWFVRKIIFFTFLASMCLTFAFECNSDKEDTPPVTLSVPEEKIVVNSDAGTKTIDNIDAQGGNWTVLSEQSWLSVRKLDERTIQVNYSENTGEERSTGIQITLGDQSQELLFVQEAPPTLSLTHTNITLEAVAGSKAIGGITATRGEWEVSEEADWITSTRKLDAHTLEITYQANLSAARSAKIQLNVRKVSREITVNQETLRISLPSSTVLIGAAAGTETIGGISTSGGEWSASENVDWINSTTKTQDNMLRIDFQENISPQREGTIQLSVGEISTDLTVIQSAPTLNPGNDILPAISLQQTTVTVNATAGAKNIGGISATGGDWRPSENVDWIIFIIKTSEQTLSINFRENTGDQREGKIMISVRAVHRAINIVQLSASAEPVPRITFPSPSITISANPGFQTLDGIASRYGLWLPADHSSWLDASKLISNKLWFSYTANTGAERRGFITITEQGSPIDGSATVSKNLVVVQEAPQINVGQTDIIVYHNRDVESIRITSTGAAWTFRPTAETPDWITRIVKANPNSFTSNLHIVYTENRGAERSFDITIVAGSIEKEITFTQRSRLGNLDPNDEVTISLSAANITVPGIGGSRNTRITSTGQTWSADLNNPTPWIVTEKTQIDLLNMTYKAYFNSTAASRNATIVVSAGSGAESVEQNIAVLQPAVQRPVVRINNRVINGPDYTYNVSRYRHNFVVQVGNYSISYATQPEGWIGSIFNDARNAMFSEPAGFFQTLPNESTMARSQILTVNGVDITIEQAAGSASSGILPQALYDYLGFDSLYVLRANVYIGRGSFQPADNSVTKEAVKNLWGGYTAPSPNPVLLQFGMYLDTAKLNIHYVEYPANPPFVKGATLPVLDALGNRLKNRNNTDSSVVIGNYLDIYIGGNNLLGDNVVGRANISPRGGVWIQLIQSTGSRTLAHELGHTLGLAHTNSLDACEADPARNFIMHGSVYPGQAYAGRVKSCENRIATDRASNFIIPGVRATYNTIVGAQTGAYIQHTLPRTMYPVYERVHVSELGSASLADVLAGWGLVTSNNTAYNRALSSTYLFRNRTARDPLPRVLHCGVY